VLVVFFKLVSLLSFNGILDILLALHEPLSLSLFFLLLLFFRCLSMLLAVRKGVGSDRVVFWQ
jgi:hypothetical protein